ncbi:MAG: ABC transporter substrate-binding protein [Actinobacteria bacterium]|nr:ABC transporter substrate-binding protein [Actinomycetota bacterium]
MNVRKVVAGLAVATTLALAACGNDSNPSAGKTTTTASTPALKRVVSMSATATEMLFAIGADKQVVAVDDQSNYPARVPKTGLSAYQPSVEAIAAQTPDLVVIASDTKGIKAQLEKLSIPVLIEPAAKTLNDTYTQITDLGRRTGHADKARAVISRMRDRIATLKKSVPKRTPTPTYYHELDNTLFSVTSKTFIGELYALAGLENVADPADANGQTGGYPQLSAEYLVKADPDLIFLADTKCCAQNRDTVAARPGFAGLKAVKNGHVIALDDDIASRWGPRVVDLFQRIIDAVQALPQQ